MRAPPLLLLLLLLAVSTTTTKAQEEDSAPVIASIQIELVGGSASKPDLNESCPKWAGEGECQNNPSYMLENCASSCKVPAMATATVYDGEDAGVGAFRFAEDYLGVTQDNIPLVLQAASKLQAALDEAEYKPPKEISHCGKRACSAGKLWKRAEEMKKGDMHDAAGADLIRALLKTGIEVDFREKCHRSLAWAIGSISRQREREKREAAEEAKAEERRQAEREAMEEAKKRKDEYEADFVKFGNLLQELIQSGKTTTSPTPEKTAEATVGADGTVETEEEFPSYDDLLIQVYQTYSTTPTEENSAANNNRWNETIQLLKKIPMGDKTVEAFLVEARCHEMLGNHKLALSAAGRLVQKAADYQPWINDSPRMMAATLGANAAMQLGLSDNALSFYQTVLKFDPEQKRARKQYRGLKKVVKLMNKAEEQIQKGYNKAASVHVDDCLSAMRGLDVDSPLFRSKIQLKQCTILSGMGKYEEALENCDIAVELRAGNDAVSAASKKEAHLARGEALLLDMDYDEAVSDFRAAFDLTADDADDKRELHMKLQQTMRQQEAWNGGKKDHRFNEHTGYPDGMPPQRDHAKILQLPIDLEEREKGVKCAWLKKQFKLLVRKYHPDKYKGNKKRAARKFKEVKEAKEIISSSWGCGKGGG